jgi:hypothetical protein
VLQTIQFTPFGCQSLWAAVAGNGRKYASVALQSFGLSCALRYFFVSEGNSFLIAPKSIFAYTS